MKWGAYRKARASVKRNIEEQGPGPGAGDQRPGSRTGGQGEVLGKADHFGRYGLLTPLARRDMVPGSSVSSPAPCGWSRRLVGY